MSIKIVADATIPYLPLGMPGREEGVEAVYLMPEEFTPERLSAEQPDALMVRSVVQCNATLLEGSPVRLVTTATAGYDHIDAAYCARQGIEWHNAPGCNAGGVVQYVLAVLSTLAMERGIRLRHFTVGIVGVGHVGSRLERALRSLGCQVLLVDPPREKQEGRGEFTTLEEVARRCNVVTFHTPLTREGEDATYHLLSYDFLSRCACKPIIINACRGAVADTQALIQAKREGLISDVVVDCWEGEPNISAELLALARIASPHIAGFSAEGKARGAYTSLEQMGRFFHLPLSKLSAVKPEAPAHPIISLQDSEYALEEALVRTIDLRGTDSALRAHHRDFKSIRRAYRYPNEPAAYTVQGVVDQEARRELSAVGFALA